MIQIKALLGCVWGVGGWRGGGGGGGGGVGGNVFICLFVCLWVFFNRHSWINSVKPSLLVSTFCTVLCFSKDSHFLITLILNKSQRTKKCLISWVSREGPYYVEQQRPSSACALSQSDRVNLYSSIYSFVCIDPLSGNEGPDQTAQMRSLVGTFTARILA